MNYLAAFTEKDVFPKKINNKDDTFFSERLVGKAIVFDSNQNIALVGNRVNDFFLLPGGGIEKGELVVEGITRECAEEIGCNVEIECFIGVTEDFRPRDKKHCVTHCYTANIKGQKEKQQLTEEERKNGMYVHWVPVKDALVILEKQKRQLENGEVPFYNTCFNILRDLVFLKEMIKKYEKNISI